MNCKWCWNCACMIIFDIFIDIKAFIFPINANATHISQILIYVVYLFRWNSQRQIFIFCLIKGIHKYFMQIMCMMRCDYGKYCSYGNLLTNEMTKCFNCNWNQFDIAAFFFLRLDTCQHSLSTLTSKMIVKQHVSC